MYMRVTRSRVDPARLDEVNRVRLDVAVATKRLPGNHSVLLAQDRATGEGLAVTTWDTEDHARFSRDALGDLVSRLQAVGVQLDPPQIFEVTAS
jgi:hypothetical protein